MKLKLFKYDCIKDNEGNVLFETFGDDLDRVKQYPDNMVWTVIDGGGVNLIIVAGMRFVNRLNYVVTKKPWKDSNEMYLF